MRLTSTDGLAMSFERDGGTVVVRIDGAVDLTNAAELEDALAGIILDQGSMSVRLDLTGTTFINSPGLQCIRRAERWLHDKKGELTVANARSSVREVLVLGGLPIS